MTARETENKIRQTVKKLFDEGKIDLFIGYSCGTLPLVSTPYFVDNAGDVGKLIWNPTCCNNLAVYLPRFFSSKPAEEAKLPRIGILAKGCDGRSIVGLVKENQIPREQLTIVGVSCEGVIHLSKIKSQVEMETISEAKVEGEEIAVVDDNGRETRFKKEDVLADACFSCQISTPPVHDVLIGNKGHNQSAVAPFGEVQAFEKNPQKNGGNTLQNRFQNASAATPVAKPVLIATARSALLSRRNRSGWGLPTTSPTSCSITSAEYFIRLEDVQIVVLASEHVPWTSISGFSPTNW